MHLEILPLGNRFGLLVGDRMGQYSIRIKVAAVLLASLSPAASYCQSTQIRPSFEVVSVKLHTSSERGSVNTTRGDRFVATNFTLRRLILMAYGARRTPLLNQQLIGGPNWISTEALISRRKPVRVLFPRSNCA